MNYSNQAGRQLGNLDMQQAIKGAAVEAPPTEVMRLINALDQTISHARELGRQLEDRLEHVISGAAPVGQATAVGPAEIIQSPLGNRIAAMERDLAAHCFAVQDLLSRLKV